MPLLRLQSLSKRFDGGPAVLEGIDLAVETGEFVTFIGPSGCGKSTLLRLIAGLEQPSAGEIRTDSPNNVEEASSLFPSSAARRSLATVGEKRQAASSTFFVFQDPTLLPWRRVAGNVELPLQLRGDSPEARRARAREMLALVGLADAAHKFPWQLSGGMRMRVSLARALSVAPKLLLLDEPFGALDEMTRDRLNEDLLAIRERDPFTAFFVTHSIAEAVFLSTRIVVLAPAPGRIARIVDVPFAYPRTAELREKPEYLNLLAETSKTLRAVEPVR